jgi:hypothetical protein
VEEKKIYGTRETVKVGRGSEEKEGNISKILRNV